MLTARLIRSTDCTPCRLQPVGVVVVVHSTLGVRIWSHTFQRALVEILLNDPKWCNLLAAELCASDGVPPPVMHTLPAARAVVRARFHHREHNPITDEQMISRRFHYFIRAAPTTTTLVMTWQRQEMAARADWNILVKPILYELYTASIATAVRVSSVYGAGGHGRLDHYVRIQKVHKNGLVVWRPSAPPTTVKLWFSLSKPSKEARRTIQQGALYAYDPTTDEMNAVYRKMLQQQLTVATALPDVLMELVASYCHISPPAART
jgi:hypothetical protein